MKPAPTMNSHPYPAYKPSGVEWLGQIPVHWEVKRLRHLTTVNDEVLMETADPGMEITYVDIGNVDSIKGITSAENLVFGDAPSRARRIVRQGDVIVSTVRTYLRAIAGIGPADANIIVSTGFAVIRPRHIDSRFLAYAISAPYFVERVVAHSVGVSYPAINASDLTCLDVANPPLPEQRAIAAFLDRETAKIDALVAKKERLIELLREKRTTLISHAVTRGLDPDVRLKDSGVEWLGEIPEHWEVKRLKHVLRLHRGAIKAGPFGSQLKNTEMMVGDIKVYNQRSVIDHDFTVGHNYISVQKFEELRAFEVFPNDILITTRGTIGKCAIIPVGSERGILHPCLIRIQFDSRRVHGRFAEVLIQDSVCVLGQLKLKSNATTIAVIYSESLREAWLALPPLPEQRTIAAFLDRETERIDALVAKVREAIDRLKELRVSLISAAVTGRIDVREEAGCS